MMMKWNCLRKLRYIINGLINPVIKLEEQEQMFLRVYGKEIIVVNLT